MFGSFSRYRILLLKQPWDLAGKGFSGAKIQIHRTPVADVEGKAGPSRKVERREERTLIDVAQGIFNLRVDDFPMPHLFLPFPIGQLLVLEEYAPGV
jgi:hypothetical protein